MSVEAIPVGTARDHDPTWRELALCAQVGGDFWFPKKGANSHQVAQAVSICRRCPVRQDCERDAFAFEAQPGMQRFGIRAGLTPRQRARLARDGRVTR